MLEGRDLIGQAQTGSGKTLAFGRPLVERCDPQMRQVQALVLTPTRELARRVGGGAEHPGQRGRDQRRTGLRQRVVRVTGVGTGGRRSGSGGHARAHPGSPEAANAAAGTCAASIPLAAEFDAHSSTDGIAYYADGGFPGEYTDSLFVAQWGNNEGRPESGQKVIRVPVTSAKLAPFLSAALYRLLGSESKPAGVH